MYQEGVVMDYYSDYYWARQHLNLSDLAYEVIENDKSVFLEKPSRQRILNIILRNYMDSADAAIDLALERYMEHLYLQLSNIPDGDSKTNVITALTDAYRQDLLHIATSYPKGRSFKIQLDKENYAAMMDWRDDNGYYENVPGRFLKAVVEEYARKPQYEREGILLRNIIEELQSCVESHQLVLITLNGPNHPRHEVRPFSICCDESRNYHYLVGMTRRAGTTHPERIASFRISRINTIKRLHSRSGKITSAQAQDINNKLRDVGVQFLLQDTQTITVRLTEQGKRMYDSQVHLRPVYRDYEKNSDGSWLYTFDCAQMQAEFYFFKFGADAIIEQPIELKEKLLGKYQMAIEVYQQ